MFPRSWIGLQIYLHWYWFDFHQLSALEWFVYNFISSEKNITTSLIFFFFCILKQNIDIAFLKCCVNIWETPDDLLKFVFVADWYYVGLQRFVQSLKA